MRVHLRRAFEFCCAPVVDHFKGPSITRLLSIYFALLVGVVVVQTKTITLNALWLSLASLAAAFGKSTFSFLLQRMQFTGTQAEARTETVAVDLRLPSIRQDDERSHAQ